MSGPRFSVLSSGLVALDVIQAPTGTWLRAGGTAANVAGILSFLGWRSAIIGQIGDDDAGHVVEADLRAAGVDTALLQLANDTGTPIVVHEIVGSGHRFKFGCARCGRRYNAHRPANPKIVDGYLDTARLADVFFFDRASLSSLRLAAAHKEANRLIVYEPGSAGRLSLHAKAIALANVVKFSDERRPLFEQALGECGNDQIWIETLGVQGLRYKVGRNPWEHSQLIRVASVDAGGAGDWMTSGLISRMAGTWKTNCAALSDALSYGESLAALACLVPGARTLSELISFAELSDLAERVVRGDVLSIPRTVKEPVQERVVCPECRLPLRALIG